MTRFVEGNQIKLLCNGTEFFPALKAAIDSAKREIYLETYIFEDDITGKKISDALKRAARRGVTTHLMLDGFGSLSLQRTILDDLLEAGVQVLIYRPERDFFRLHRNRLRRLHRKIALIDTQTAFVGGINIVDDRDMPGQTSPRFDYAVQVQGPLLQDIYASVKRLWGLVSWSQLKLHRHSRLRRIVTRVAGNMSAAFVIRDNIGHRRDIENAYLEAINQAKVEIVLANAYFLPRRNFRRALIRASARGVRVVLLLQGRVEYVLLHYATRALYGVFLDSGIEIYEYHESFLHAKVGTIDGEWSTVGSSNIDPFSLLLAREANVVVRDVGFAVQLRASLEHAMEKGARVMTAEAWKHQPIHNRLLSWLSYAAVRLLMGVAGYGRNRIQG
ncbi:MAG: cardiolipin synthase ClsB [Sulfuricellaceae bacterium]|nr:cardiolipin synthase ClsB [Sulfuricellaceae bacterium]